MPMRTLVAVLITLLTGFILTVPAPVATAQDAPAQAARPTPPPAPADVAEPPADAVKTDSGLYTKLVTPGSGADRPAASDVVTVLYTGWTTEGRVFDSSVLRNNRPSTFQLNTVLPGWAEGVQMMVKGETRRLWVPENLAFKGAEGRPKGMVVFDIELVDFKPSPTAAPPDVAEPPPNAKRTGSGLAYRVLVEGAGEKHPGRLSTVTVHYTGWTTDGKMFDSSVVRGQPASFPLENVIKGWTEGLQLMVEGEKTRFWIPQDLAYGGQSGKPHGMLVFDVELIKIQ